MTDITRHLPLRWQAHGMTHQGARRNHNEDAIYSGDHQQLWLVADGMGGHQRGDLASQQIVAGLQKLTDTGPRFSDRVTALEDALLTANQTIYDYAAQQLQGNIIGSTLVALVLQGGLGFACWVGDSRLYRLRQGQLKCLTRDHSRLQDMLDRGVIGRNQVAAHPEANIITRALGVERFLQLDMTLFSAQFGDSFLLCSDGLYNAVGEAQIARLLGDPHTEHACEGLIKAALDNDARDNISAIVVRAQPSIA